MDYSGFELRYLDHPRTLDAGVLELGHTVTKDMMIPPGSTSFSIFGICDESCTSSVSEYVTRESMHMRTCTVCV